MEKTYMKYMKQGSGTDYKMKTAPEKTKKAPTPGWQGEGGVNEGSEYDEYVKMMLKKKGITNLGDLSDEETKAFFAEIDKGYKAKNETNNDLTKGRKLATVPGGSDTEYPVKTKPEKKKKQKDGWQGDDGGVADVVEKKKLKAELPMSFESSNYNKVFEAYQIIKKTDKKSDKKK
jgi:hypothetical protein